MTKQRMMFPVRALAVALCAALVFTSRPVYADDGRQPDHKPGCQGVLSHADLEGQTPVVWTVLAPPIFPVQASDGRIHLAYELTITSLTPVPMKIETVEVIDPTRGDLVVDIISGDDVASRLAVLPFGPADVSATLGPNETRVLLFDVAFETREDAPEALAHRVTVAFDPASVPATFTWRGGCAAVSRRPALVLSPPLQGDGWGNVDGCCMGDEHRRHGMTSFHGALQNAQRFATDLMRGDAEGRVFVGDPADVTHWVGYGAEVIAAAPGRVLTVVDGFPDEIPLEEPSAIGFANPAGNHVIIAMGDGRFALYAHLAPHRIAVREGERVRRGQRLGLLGNSGLTKYPHLHFHVADGPGFSASGAPYVFDRWTFQGRVADVDLKTGIVEIDRTESGEQRRKELPLYFDVIGFRDPR